MSETPTIRAGYEFAMQNLKGVAEFVEHATARRRVEILPFRERSNHCHKWTDIQYVVTIPECDVHEWTTSTA